MNSAAGTQNLLETGFNRWLERLAAILWGLALLTLPVTSFPYFPFFGPDTQVRPLSLYPTLALFPVLVIQLWRRKIKLWDESLTPLLVFMLIALLASALGALYAPLELRGQTYWGRVLRAWITLALGLMFFLYAIWMSRSPGQLRSSLRWLYSGLAISFIWGILQFLSNATLWVSKAAISRVQDLFTITSSASWGLRTPGFALEPSWLAGQLACLYLPWLFASLLNGYRISRHRWLEFVLLGMACISLILTYSRGGIALAFAATFLTALLTGREHLLRLWRWWLEPFHRAGSPAKPSGLSWTVRLGALFLLVAGVGGAFYILSRSDYFTQLWRSQKTDVVSYIVDIYAGPRLAYAWAALRAFAAHPWSGVGLGASGFYILRFLPDWSRTMIPETTIYLNPQSGAFLNPKNLYARLLAETGVFGFAAFVTFYFYLLGKVRSWLQDKERRLLGVAGLFTWFALALSFFTQDSFAMPSLWVNFGILLGLAAASRPITDK
jgi:O-antigen ligase